MIKLAIIGTSGRDDDDLSKLDYYHLQWMANKVESYIKDVLHTEPSNIILISGGSAWADHVAVQLYLDKEKKFAGLELYLPSKFDLKYNHYVNTHEGRLLNKLHKQCQEKTDIDVLLELGKVLHRPGVKVVIKRGFPSRNTLIAKNCDYLLAFSFGETNEFGPLKGGTLDTWKKVLHCNKSHYDLNFCKEKKYITIV